MENNYQLSIVNCQLFFNNYQLKNNYMKLKHKILGAAFLLLVVGKIAAQPISGSRPELILQLAEERLAAKDLVVALDKFEEYYKKVPSDKSITYKVALLQYSVRDYTKAETWLSRSLQVDKKKGGEVAEVAPDARFLYGRVLKMNEKYEEAIVALEEYIASSKDDAKITLAKNELIGAKMALKMGENTKVTVENMGNKVNSTEGEYSPSFSGGTLYYTSHRRNELITLDGKEGDYHAKVYTSKKNGEKGWSEAEAVGDMVNRPGVEQGNVFVSQNGKVMYFTRVTLNGNIAETSKIFFSTKGADGAWSAANEVAGVNGNFISKQPCLGELFGKEALFFVSNMEGSKGGFDIYYAPKIEDGSFGLPVNLGAAINTSGEEETPYYRDGKLYFSSTGHAGIGGFDVFSSAWNGSNWSSPQNLGKGYNSAADDLYYTMNDDGQGFVVSNRVGTKSIRSKTCCDDIFAVNVEVVKANLKGIAMDGKKSLSGVTFQLVEMANGKPGKTDSKSVEAYTSSLDLEKTYMLIGSKTGYYNDTVRFNTVKLPSTTLFEKTLNLKAIPVVPPPPPPPPPAPPIKTKIVTKNVPIRINNIYYAYNDSKIIYEEAKSALDYIYGVMVNHPDIVIELGSHTDSRGADTYNMNLSQKRAESARAYLTAKGITGDRIIAKGYGETQLINQCSNGVQCTDEEHQANRRTEFKIISGPTEDIIIEEQR
jgi:peptidoglycan-associated lipoprotein